jgi:hypothetical protein
MAFLIEILLKSKMVVHGQDVEVFIWDIME